MIDHRPGSRRRRGAHTPCHPSQSPLLQTPGLLQGRVLPLQVPSGEKGAQLFPPLQKNENTNSPDIINRSPYLLLAPLQQQVELKHGRVAMLACLGTLVQSYTHVSFGIGGCGRGLVGAEGCMDRPLLIVDRPRYLPTYLDRPTPPPHIHTHPRPRIHPYSSPTTFSRTPAPWAR